MKSLCYLITEIDQIFQIFYTLFNLNGSIRYNLNIPIKRLFAIVPIVATGL